MADEAEVQALQVRAEAAEARVRDQEILIEAERGRAREAGEQLAQAEARFAGELQAVRQALDAEAARRFAAEAQLIVAGTLLRGELRVAHEERAWRDKRSVVSHGWLPSNAQGPGVRHGEAPPVRR